MKVYKVILTVMNTTCAVVKIKPEKNIVVLLQVVFITAKITYTFSSCISVGLFCRMIEKKTRLPPAVNQHPQIMKYGEMAMYPSSLVVFMGVN